MPTVQAFSKAILLTAQDIFNEIKVQLAKQHIDRHTIPAHSTCNQTNSDRSSTFTAPRPASFREPTSISVSNQGNQKREKAQAVTSIASIHTDSHPQALDQRETGRTHRIGVLTQLRVAGKRCLTPVQLTSRDLHAYAKKFNPDDKRTRKIIDQIITHLRFHPFGEGTKVAVDHNIVVDHRKAYRLMEFNPEEVTSGIETRSNIPNGIRILYVVDTNGDCTNVYIVKVGTHKEIETYLKSRFKRHRK